MSEDIISVAKEEAVNVLVEALQIIEAHTQADPAFIAADITIAALKTLAGEAPNDDPNASYAFDRL